MGWHVSKQAEAIEQARLVFVMSQGTAYEKAARKNLERVIEAARKGRAA